MQVSGFSCEIACSLDSGRAVARQIAHLLAESGYDDATQFACELAVTEACNNTVQHATRHQRGQPLRVSMRCSADAIELAVRDRTAGFDLQPIRTPPGPDAIAGRGLFLIHSMMDEVTYAREGDGNVLHMKKRVATPKTAATA